MSTTKRSVMVIFRLTPTERRKVREAAEEQEITISEYIRRKVFA